MSVRSPLPAKLDEPCARINPGTRESKAQKGKRSFEEIEFEETQDRAHVHPVRGASRCLSVGQHQPKGSEPLLQRG